MNKKIQIPIIALVVLIITFFAYSAYALNSVQVQDFNLNNIGTNKQMDFVIEGDVVVHNPSLLTAKITSINYTVVLEKTDEIIFQGDIDGKDIPAGETVNLEFESVSDWVPSATTASGMLKSEKIYIVIIADVNAKLIFFDVSSQMQTKMDIAPMVKPLIQQQIQNVLSTLGGLLK